MSALPSATQLVDTGVLLKVVWVSLTAGVGVTVAFSLLVLGSARAGDARREGRRLPALGYFALALFGLSGTLLALWLGWEFVVNKS